MAGLATVAVVALAASLLTGPAGRPAAPGGRKGPTVTAAYVLAAAAAAAARAPQPVPRPGQYIYVRSVDTYLAMDVLPHGDRSWLYSTARQIWLSASGSKTGLLRAVLTGQEKLPWGPVPPPAQEGRVSWDPLPPGPCLGPTPPRNSYEFLATLPTSPARLRAWIYAHKDGQQPANQQAWTDIGDMLREMLVPPKLAAALFRVAATIPGVTVVRHATDAAGRTGVAVARYDPSSKADTELIFSPRSYRYLGERSVLVAPVKGQGPAGTVIASTAQLEVAVVSHLPRKVTAAQGPGWGTPSGPCPRSGR